MAMTCSNGSRECTGCMRCFGELEPDYMDYYEEDDGLEYDY